MGVLIVLVFFKQKTAYEMRIRDSSSDVCSSDLSLEELPDFPQDERVFFLEDMVASDAPGTGIFKTAFSDKKTTGSWAVRFAIYLGYTDISLGGIDCSYVEVIRQAERTGTDLELKIGSEVDANPNYFFDDYQKQGDTDRKSTRLNP